MFFKEEEIFTAFAAAFDNNKLIDEVFSPQSQRKIFLPMPCFVKIAYTVAGQ